MTEHLPMHAS